MPSMQKIQKLVDEIYIIKESTAELNEEMSEKVNELIEHQKTFMSSTETTLSQLNSSFKDNISKSNNVTNNLKITCEDAIERTEDFIRDIEEEKHTKIDKLRKTRLKILLPLIVLTASLVWINFYLAKKVYQKQSRIAGIPIIYKDANKYYVKIKPNTTSTGQENGKDITYAEIG